MIGGPAAGPVTWAATVPAGVWKSVMPCGGLRIALAPCGERAEDQKQDEKEEK